MALTTNRISIKNVISKVYRDLQIDQEFDGLDIIEWAVEGFRFIGAFQQYKDKKDCLKVENYRVSLPCDLISLYEIGYDGLQLDQGSVNRLPSIAPEYPAPYSFLEQKMDSVAFKVGMLHRFPKSDKTFIIENGWIKTNFKEGFLDIRYKALETDDMGIPLIPDDVSYKEALFWFIAKKYFYAKTIREDRYRWLYQDAEQKWQWYCNQAGAKALEPSVFQLENIKRNFLSILPKVNSYKEFFENLNDF